MTAYEACRLDELVEGRGITVRLPDRYLALFLDRGELVCIDNECPHVGSPLARGAVEDGRVVCPSHGWTFDLRSGALCTPFGERPGVRTYPTSVVDGVVRVHVEEGPCDT